LGIIGSGAWYPFEGENLGQGETNALKTLRANPALMQKIETKCRFAKMPQDAQVEAVGQNGAVVVQEGPKTEPSPSKAAAAPRKRAAAGKAAKK
jgi:hypothetical protein